MRIEMGGLVLTEKRDFAIKMDGTTKNKKAKIFTNKEENIRY